MEKTEGVFCFGVAFGWYFTGENETDLGGWFVGIGVVV
jgi:hypothetical protein